jgi:hypothetical protein
VVLSNEYCVKQAFDKNYFACFTLDTVTHKYTFVFNNKRIFTTILDVEEYGKSHWDEEIEGLYLPKHYDDEFYSRSNFPYINSSEDNGYKFKYKKIEGNDTNLYVNNKGVVEGPFEDVIFNIEPAFFRWGSWDKNYDYKYQLAGQWYGHSSNGKNKRININSSKSKDWAQSNDYENGKLLVNIDRERRKNKTSPYISASYNEFPIDYLDIRENNNYICSYFFDNKMHIIVNGNEVATYNDHFRIDNSCLTDNGKYAYTIGLNTGKHVIINGADVAVYEDAGSFPDLCLTENGKYVYSYCTYTDNKTHININGNERGSYDNVYNLQITEEGKYYFCYYTSTEGMYYENNNGRIRESTERILNIWGQTDECKNTKIGLHCIDILSPDKSHSFYSAFRFEFVVIDGDSHGKAPALQAWYDKNKNAFIWNTIEGRELVVYEYKLD